MCGIANCSHGCGLIAQRPGKRAFFGAAPWGDTGKGQTACATVSAPASRCPASATPSHVPNCAFSFLIGPVRPLGTGEQTWMSESGSGDTIQQGGPSEPTDAPLQVAVRAKTLGAATSPSGQQRRFRDGRGTSAPPPIGDDRRRAMLCCSALLLRGLCHDPSAPTIFAVCCECCDVC